MNPTIPSPGVPLHILLRRRREELKLLQSDVAEALHVRPECVGLWEAGRRRMELCKIPRLAAVLQIDPQQLCAKALAESTRFSVSPSLGITRESCRLSTGSTPAGAALRHRFGRRPEQAEIIAGGLRKLVKLGQEIFRAGKLDVQVAGLQHDLLRLVWRSFGSSRQRHLGFSHSGDVLPVELIDSLVQSFFAAAFHLKFLALRPGAGDVRSISAGRPG